MTMFGPSINGESFFYHCEEHVDVKRFKFFKNSCHVFNVISIFIFLKAFLLKKR